MHCIFRGRIELAVTNTAACGHALAIARQNHRACSKAVLMPKLPFEYVGDDFHVTVRMRRKSRVRRDPVLVDHAQRAESHPLRVPKISKTKSVVRLEPAVVSATALLTRTNLNHGISPCIN